MNKMIENVAIAMATEYYGKPPEPEDFFLQGVVDVRALARAAIRAMGSPTDAMIKAGTIGWDPMDGSPIKAVFDPTKPYQAMIDAALKND